MIPLAAVTLKKFQNEIILALALILLGAGVGYNTTSEEQYNPYESRVLEIDGMMQGALNNPTETGLADAQQDIFYTYSPWAQRQVAGEQKDNFIAYLEACNQVIIEKSNGIEPDTSKMIKLKNELL